MTTTVMTIKDGSGTAQTLAVEQSQTGVLSPHSVPEVAGAPVTTGNPLPIAGVLNLLDAAGVNKAAVDATGALSTQDATRTPAAGTAAAIVTGGTAVVAITGPVKGGYIVNPAGAADQAITTAETLYVDPVNSPGSTAGSANGTCVALVPGQDWVLPCPIPAGVSVRANAATSGHKFTVVVWA